MRVIPCVHQSGRLVHDFALQQLPAGNTSTNSLGYHGGSRTCHIKRGESLPEVASSPVLDVFHATTNDRQRKQTMLGTNFKK
jgi:hypothetical protein